MSWSGNVDADDVLKGLASGLQAVLERAVKDAGPLREVAQKAALAAQAVADARHAEREEQRAREAAHKERTGRASAQVYWSDYRALRGFTEWLQHELDGAKAAIDASNLGALHGVLATIADRLAALERARKAEIDEAVKQGAQMGGAW